VTAKNLKGIFLRAATFEFQGTLFLKAFLLIVKGQCFYEPSFDVDSAAVLCYGLCVLPIRASTCP
jgi:hypothetical protein